MGVVRTASADNEENASAADEEHSGAAEQPRGGVGAGVREQLTQLLAWLAPAQW
ncbi:hypothetical protein STVIR_8005 [Streptomyces viridochromogenes Tue57]|uniref:Uncharacterized protein n=1 Tax=Streptomyces viridochromogenes Tue57 TaxID=1160705 RepID=L8P4E6_STRVR|nr:hypothetical protein STVIR_8005 [Streptomyces viridochromogenes Tue57]